MEGAVEFLQSRKKIDVVALHSSKLSFEDLKKPNIYKVLDKKNIVLPPILADLERYSEALDYIAERNFISELDTSGASPTDSKKAAAAAGH